MRAPTAAYMTLPVWFSALLPGNGSVMDAVAPLAATLSITW